MIKPVVLLILDGWGLAPSGPGNAIALAKTPNMDRFLNVFPNTELIASGEAAGLPKGEAGNTETGHINLGAGHIVYQDLPRIDQAIADGSFFANEAFIRAANHVKNFNSNMHIMGLVGAGGVHSSNEHLFALLRFMKNQNVNNVYLHLFTDGRDSPPTSAASFVEKIEREILLMQVGKIATVMGRYYSMDRDRRWQRTQKAYEALTGAKGKTAKCARDVVAVAYNKDVTDEFIEPTIILNASGKPLPRINHNDSVIFFNFRIDRPRQLTKAFVLSDLESCRDFYNFDPYDIKYHKKHMPDLVETPHTFKRGALLKNLHFVTMTEYEKDLPVDVAFGPLKVASPLSGVVADHNLKQLKVAETEKERFVTYYFNGLREDPFIGEDRIIIPSAKVSTYDQKPEMSAEQITRTLLERVTSKAYDLIVVNYANADMLGHTGNIKATSEGCEVLDRCVGQVVMNIIGQGGVVLITADHGNAEQMISKTTGEVDTEHSCNSVPFIVVSDFLKSKKIKSEKGILADVAATILKFLGVEKPVEMTGRELI